MHLLESYKRDKCRVEIFYLRIKPGNHDGAASVLQRRLTSPEPFLLLLAESDVAYEKAQVLFAGQPEPAHGGLGWKNRATHAHAVRLKEHKAVALEGLLDGGEQGRLGSANKRQQVVTGELVRPG